MSLRTVRSARSLPSLKQALHSSSTAPKPSHLLSSSRDNMHSHYASLTVNVLKQECRVRGLKLNGRKNELVDRLVGFEQTKSFSSAVSKATPRSKVAMKLKPDASSFSTTAAAEHPDAVQISIPRVPPTTADINAPKFKMPVQPDNTKGAVEVDANYTKRNISTDPAHALGDVHVVDGAPKVSTMNVDLGDGAPKHDEERTGSKNDTVSPGDKTFLAVLGGAIAAWWGSKYVGKTKAESGSKH